MFNRTLITIVLIAGAQPGISQHAAPATESGTAEILNRVAAIHGAPGVFAVAGYRIGVHALEALGARRGSFSLSVVHKTPSEVQWSCVADGIQAATGVSAGKLNLRIEEASKQEYRTIVTDRKSGRELIYRIRPEFLKHYLDTPFERQGAVARDVLKMSDAEIFSLEEIAKR